MTPLHPPRTRRRRTVRRFTLTGVVLGAVLALVGGPGAAGAASKPTTASVISTAANAKLGTILVADDAAVYTLKPGKKDCTAKCLKAWPPVLLPEGVTTATAGPGVEAASLGSAAAAHGARQITYGGKPLYWLGAGTAPGQAQGSVSTKWGTWSVVVTGPAGAAATSPAGTNDGSGSGATTGGTTTGGSSGGSTGGGGSPGGSTAGGGSTGGGSTETPATAPPATSPPQTNPPAPPPTDPPDPKPRPTNPPNNGGVGF